MKNAKAFPRPVQHNTAKDHKPSIHNQTNPPLSPQTLSPLRDPRHIYQKQRNSNKKEELTTTHPPPPNHPQTNRQMPPHLHNHKPPEPIRRLRGEKPVFISLNIEVADGCHERRDEGGGVEGVGVYEEDDGGVDEEEEGVGFVEEGVGGRGGGMVGVGKGESWNGIVGRGRGCWNRGFYIRSRDWRFCLESGYLILL